MPLSDLCEEAGDQEECLRLDVFIKSPDDAAACLATVEPFLRGYIWQKDRFYLCDAKTHRCPWVNEPSSAELPDTLLWARMRHEGNPTDAWFTAFLLSCITTAVPGAVARLQDEDGVDLFVTEAADYLPAWLDSSRYGTLEAIAQNRFWVFDGNLHVIPIKGAAGMAAPIASVAAAISAVRDPQQNTAAPARVQEHIKRQQLARFPDAARRAMHATRVLLPARAASVLLAEPQLAALAVDAFVQRDPAQLRAALAFERFPRQDEQMCVLRLNRNHYAALHQTQFSAVPGWPLPPLSHPAARPAEFGLKLCLGLEIVASGCGTPPVDTGAQQAGSDEAVPALSDAEAALFQRYVDALERKGFFGDNIAGSAQHRRLVSQLRAEFVEQRSALAAATSQSRHTDRLAELLQQPVDHDAIRRSAAQAADSDEWMHKEMQEEMERFEATQRGDRGAANRDAGPLDAADISEQVNRFMQGQSGLEGADVAQGPLSMNVKQLLSTLEQVIGQLPQADRPRDESDDDDSERTWSDTPTVSDSDSDEVELSDSDATVSDGGAETRGARAAASGAQERHQSGSGRGFMEQYMSELDLQMAEAAQGDGAGEKPVTVDMEAVQNLMRSALSGADGAPGAASGLLGMMGIQLPPGAEADE